jgi:hypothetical protein
MNWIEVGLGSGMLITIGGWIWAAGVNKHKGVVLEKRVTDLENCQEKVEDRLNQGDILHSTINAKLDLLIEYSQHRRATDG